MNRQQRRAQEAEARRAAKRLPRSVRERQERQQELAQRLQGDQAMVKLAERLVQERTWLAEDPYRTTPAETEEDSAKAALAALDEAQVREAKARDSLCATIEEVLEDYDQARQEEADGPPLVEPVELVP